MRGDSNNSGALTPADSIHLNLFIFLGGEAPLTACQADTNSNNVVTPADSIYLNQHLFLAGPPPSEAGEPPSCVVPLARTTDGLADAPKDVLALGEATVEAGGTAIIPVSITDQPGTRIDASKSDPIGALSVFVRFPAGLVTGASAALSGVCSGFPIAKDFISSGPDYFVYLVHFDSRQRALPLTEKSSGPGDECLRLAFNVSPTARKGTYALELDDEKSSLVSKSGRIGANKKEEPLRLNAGRITVR